MIMAAIDWNENLSVRIDSIDFQHKKLIDLINSFYDHINQGSQKEKMLELIKSLKDYTVFHFSIEEKYMKQINYPGYMNHKFEHDKFIGTVQNFEDRYKNGKLLLTVEITNFIKDWISKHIMGTDKKYSDFFIKNGVR
jgi:hemerythrin